MKRVFCKKPAFWGTITILAVDAAVDFCALDSRCRGQVVERLWDFTVAGCVRRREERARYLRIPRRKDCCLYASHYSLERILGSFRQFEFLPRNVPIQEDNLAKQ